MDSNLEIFDAMPDPDLNEHAIPQQVALVPMQSDVIGLHKRACSRLIR
jgi:hypothetical protein